MITDKPTWYVYILKCSDGIIYVGCTGDINERIARHQKGHVTYTSSRIPVQLITYITFTDKYKAFEFERYLKSGSGRVFFKRHLI